MNIIDRAEEGKANAMYRLSALALREERKGNLKRAEELRRRIEVLKAA